jgi:hypothetical protein
MGTSWTCSERAATRLRRAGARFADGAGRGCYGARRRRGWACCEWPEEERRGRPGRLSRALVAASEQRGEREREGREDELTSATAMTPAGRDRRRWGGSNGGPRRGRDEGRRRWARNCAKIPDGSVLEASWARKLRRVVLGKKYSVSCAWAYEQRRRRRSTRALGALGVRLGCGSGWARGWRGGGAGLALARPTRGGKGWRGSWAGIARAERSWTHGAGALGWGGGDAELGRLAQAQERRVALGRAGGKREGEEGGGWAGQMGQGRGDGPLYLFLLLQQLFSLFFLFTPFDSNSNMPQIQISTLKHMHQTKVKFRVQHDATFHTPLEFSLLDYNYT